MRNPAACATAVGEEPLLPIPVPLPQGEVAPPPVAPLAREEQEAAPPVQPAPEPPQASKQNKHPPLPLPPRLIEPPSWNEVQTQVEALLVKCAQEADRKVNEQWLQGVALTDMLCRLPYKEGQSAREALEAASKNPGVNSRKPGAREKDDKKWYHKLGEEKHREALACVKRELPALWKLFDVEPTFRQVAQGQWAILDNAAVNQLKAQGRTAELKGTLVPDLFIYERLVVSYGWELIRRAIYDFKFNCIKGADPKWSDYPEDHPHAGKSQGEMYRELLRSASQTGTPWIISPKGRFP